MKIALDVCCFFKGSFQGLLAHLEATEAILEHFATARGNVKTMGSVITASTFFCMRFDLQKLANLGIHRGPFWEHWGAIFANSECLFQGLIFE